jgi:hypothetical protein
MLHHSDYCQVEAVPGQADQKGVFATRIIKPSKVLCAEEPLLKVLPLTEDEEQKRLKRLSDSHSGAAGMSDLQHLKRLVASQHLQKAIEATIAGWTSQRTRAFFAAYDSLHKGGDSHDVFGGLDGDARVRYRIYLANRFLLGHDDAHGVFPEISRVNHSCSPNAEWAWDGEEGTMEVQAVAEIAAGQEIYLSYLPDEVLLASRAVRRTRLQLCYAFHCNCSACHNSSWTEASDMRRKTILDYRRLRPGSIENKERLETLAASCLVDWRQRLILG